MTQEKQKIHFIMTGGTIDGFYDTVGQTAKPNQSSVIPEYLQDSIKPYLNLSFETLCMKDSKDITQDDRDAMLDAAKKTQTPYIMITHGTDTMADSARYLSERHAQITDKIIVFTGSMIPLRGFSRSDSGFNLGFALAKITTLEPGVYIAMNAKIFSGDNTHKNFDIARFEDITA